MLAREERRDRRREVDAVDEDVDVEDLLEGPALGRLVQIPLDDVRAAVQSRSATEMRYGRADSLVQTDLAEKVDGAAPASPQRADDKGSDALPAPSKPRLHIVHHRVLIRVWFERTERLV